MSTGVHTGQRLVSVVAAAALCAAALTSGRYALVVPGVLLALVAAAHWHGRPLVASAGLVSRYLLRRRTGTHPEGLFPLLCPDTTVDELDVEGIPTGAIRDGSGLVAIVELADGDAIVHSAPLRTPAPAALAAATGGDGPTVTAQVLVVVRGPGRRVFVALRAGGDGRPWHDADLRDALAAAVRRAHRRADRLGAVARPLDRHATVAAVLWAAGTPPIPGTVSEAWDHLRVGTSVQVTLGFDQPPDTDQLVRLIRAPTPVVAVGWTAARTTVRLVAPDTTVLATAVTALLADLPGTLTPCDGDQLAALRATLPLATTAPTPHGTLRRVTVAPPRTSLRVAIVPPPTSPRVAIAPPRTSPRVMVSPRRASDRGLPGFRGDPAGPELPATGLLIGADRTGAPVHIRLDDTRPAPVRVAVVGGPAAARILGARLRALTRGEGPLAPVPVAVSVFDGLTAADGPALAAADVVICQPLTTGDAALVASALHLTRAGVWLSRIEGDMVAVISDGAVRWARLGTTLAEQRSHTGLVGVARS